MYADKETLANYHGEPLLNEEGMEAVSALLDAHDGYDKAGQLHGDEVKQLDAQIAALTATRQTLLEERQRQESLQHQARSASATMLREATAPHARDNNEVYAAVLRAAQSDPNHTLWYPDALATADENGRAFVELDEHLRAARHPQPAMIIERERGQWRQVYVSETLRQKGLKPGIADVDEQYGHRSITTKRDVLELPVRKNRISAFQMNPTAMGRGETLDDFAYSPTPEYANVRDAFKIVLPQNNHDGLKPLVEYDNGDEVEELSANGKLAWMNEGIGRSGSIHIAIGVLSVTRALESLQQSFLEQSERPERVEHIFRQLGQHVLGKRHLQKA
jgi:hypothetical protein